MDSIPNETPKLAVKSIPDMVAEFFQTCMSERKFPASSKQQKLKLTNLPKLKPYTKVIATIGMPTYLAVIVDNNFQERRL